MPGIILLLTSHQWHDLSIFNQSEIMSKLVFCQECPYRKILPQTPELGPDTGIWICLDSYYIFWMLGIISLLTSPQWPRYLAPKWNYVQFGVFGPKCSHIEIRPCIHKFGPRSLDFKFFNNYYISRFWKWFRFEKALRTFRLSF